MEKSTPKKGPVSEFLLIRRRFSIVLTKFSPRSFCARKSGTKRHRICIRNARNDFKTRRKRTRSARFFSFHAKRGPARSSRRRRRRSVFFLDDDAVSPDDARLGERLHLSLVCFLVEQALKKKLQIQKDAGGVRSLANVHGIVARRFRRYESCECSFRRVSLAFFFSRRSLCGKKITRKVR